MNRLVVLHGQSGMGKTSLLRAGLFPRLREVDFLPIDIRLDQGEGEETLLHKIKAATERTLATASISSPPPEADETLWEFLHRKNLDFRSVNHHTLTPVLVVDQFEQTIIGWKAANNFSTLEELVALAQNSVPRDLGERIDRNSGRRREEEGRLAEARLKAALREKRRITVAASAFALLSVLTLTFWIYAVLQRNEATTAAQRADAARNEEARARREAEVATKDAEQQKKAASELARKAEAAQAELAKLRTEIESLRASKLAPP